MKNRKKQMIAWMLTLLLVLGMAPDMGAVQAAKKMALNKKKITLQVGANTKLKVKTENDWRTDIYGNESDGGYISRGCDTDWRFGI